jgi:hypothetical protein
MLCGFIPPVFSFRFAIKTLLFESVSTAEWPFAAFLSSRHFAPSFPHITR